MMTNIASLTNQGSQRQQRQDACLFELDKDNAAHTPVKRFTLQRVHFSWGGKGGLPVLLPMLLGLERTLQLYFNIVT